MQKPRNGYWRRVVSCALRVESSVFRVQRSALSVQYSAFSLVRWFSNLRSEISNLKFPAALGLLLLAFCAPAAAESRPLGPGDRVGITVWGEKDLTREAEVRQDGKIAYPLLGEVEAAGSTAAQLQMEMAKRLQEYLRAPRVEVAVLSYADLSVYVLGQVAKPGAYTVPRGSGVMEAIALAGGVLPTADKEASLLRANRELVTIKLEELVQAKGAGTAPALQVGDVLIVPFRRQADQIAVMGQVGKPGMYAFTPGMKILDALGLAGLAQEAPDGPTRPDLSRVSLTREAENRTVDVARMLKMGDLAGNDVLRPGDIITVPETARKKVYTFGAFKSPGAHYLDGGQGLLEIILASGGPIEGAKLEKASLVRMVGGQPKTMEVDLNRLIRRGDQSQNIPLENGDVVFLPGPKKGGLRLESVMPFVPYLLF